MPDSSTFLLRGGLDLTTPSLAMDPGRLISAINMIATESGYERAPGFERFDGHAAKPSQATYWYATFSNGTNASDFAAGTEITGGSSTGEGTIIADAVVTSGSYAGGDAAGYFFLWDSGGSTKVEDFTAPETILVIGSPVGTLTANPVEQGAPNFTIHDTAMLAEKARRRALILEVPGFDEVIGVFKMNGVVYAFRDSTGSGDIAMYKSTTAGWSSVALGEEIDYTGGGGDIDVGDTLTKGGVTATIQAVSISSGTLSGSNAVGRLTISGRAGGSFSSGAATTSGSGTLTLGGAQTAITLSAPAEHGQNYRFLVDRFSAEAAEKCVISTTSGSCWLFDGTYLARIPDAGFAVQTFKFQNHLFVLKGNGAARFQGIGDPLNSTSTAGAGILYTGSYLHSAALASPDVLALFGRTKIALVSGTDATTFALTEISNDSGAYSDTVQKMGAPIFADNRGVRSLYDVETSAGFRTGSLSESISPMFTRWSDLGREGEMWTPKHTLRDRSRDLYILFVVQSFGSQGECIAGYFGRDAKSPEWTTLDLGKEVTCTWSSPGEGTASSIGAEELYFGASDGFVYQWGTGDDYDGDFVDAFLRLPFTGLGDVTARKRFLSAAVQITSRQGTTITVSGRIDIDTTNYHDLDRTNYLFTGAEAADWLLSDEEGHTYSHQGTDYIEFPIDAVGQGLSLAIESVTKRKPYTLRSVTIRFSPRGERRNRSM